MMIEAKPLSALRILVPRPSPQGDSVVAEIRQLGGEAVHFPVVETAMLDDFEELDMILRDIKQFALVIVVSVAAATSISKRMRALSLKIPDTSMVCSVGPITSQLLKRLGFRVDIEPESEFTSEGLLESLKDIDLSGKKVAIFRGQNGREKLAEELQRFGALVSCVTCYRRRTTERSFGQVVEVWQSKGFDVVIITSNNILDALLELLGAQYRTLIETTKALVISPRIAEYCRENGIDNIVVCRPGSAPVIDSLCRLASGR